MQENIALPEEITSSDLEGDGYLKPVLDDDALILCLDDLPEPDAVAEPAQDAAAKPTAGTSSPEELIQKNAELHAELDALAKQFNNYRLAVQQTLDRRWGNDEQGEGVVLPEKVTADPSGDSGKDNSAYYFESYAHNGRSFLGLPTQALITPSLASG